MNETAIDLFAQTGATVLGVLAVYLAGKKISGRLVKE